MNGKSRVDAIPVLLDAGGARVILLDGDVIDLPCEMAAEVSAGDCPLDMFEDYASMASFSLDVY